MNNISFAPVILFGFNRVDLFESLLTSLVECEGCSKTDVYIFIDGPRTEGERLEQLKFTPLINMYSSCFSQLSILFSSENQGLRRSLIGGVSSVLENYDSVIVLEDDLIVSNNFLSYMNKCLNFYKNNNEIASISGYTNEISKSNVVDNYFHLRPCSWGWATWKNRWEVIDWDYKPTSFKEWCLLWLKCKPVGDDIFRMFRHLHSGKNNSWAITWTINNIINKKMTSYPHLSKVSNIGFGVDATHCVSDNPFVTNFKYSSENNFNLLKEAKTQGWIVIKFNLYFSNLYKALFKLGFRLKNSNKGQK